LRTRRQTEQKPIAANTIPVPPTMDSTIIAVFLESALSQKTLGVF
jgi:hypothetical protein